ncbi:hypothetical protein J3R83DRAFT_12610 [Lanmaoa asiatica]|nr:hypothetical protein J3R83DRAFT_12610 [Lanmaoa asiatica]
MEMHIEFKWRDTGPFIVPSKKPRRRQNFVKKSAAAIEILGQITAYVAAQMSAQFRTHVFSILLMPKKARILRWGREGVVVTEPIHYCDNTALVDFLLVIRRPLQENVVLTPRFRAQLNRKLSWQEKG